MPPELLPPEPPEIIDIERPELDDYLIENGTGKEVKIKITY